jgi:AcrR family transcriptional regulator
MEPGSGLRERKKVQTRDKIVEVATRLFVEQGFDATTIDEIAAAADVSPRTFFRYFATKEDVVFLEQEAENDAIAKVLAARRPNEDDVELLLRAVAEALPTSIAAVKHTGALYQVVLATPSLLARAFHATVAVENILVDGLIGKRATRAEQIRARALAASFVGALRALFVYWMETGMRGDPAEVMGEIGEFLRHGFLAGRTRR